MVDVDVAMIDEERPCRHEVTGFDVRKGAVEELVRVRRPIKWKDLEDKRDAMGGARRFRGIAATAASSYGASTIVNRYLSGEVE